MNVDDKVRRTNGRLLVKYLLRFELHPPPPKCDEDKEDNENGDNEDRVVICQRQFVGMNDATPSGGRGIRNSDKVLGICFRRMKHSVGTGGHGHDDEDRFAKEIIIM